MALDQETVRLMGEKGIWAAFRWLLCPAVDRAPDLFKAAVGLSASMISDCCIPKVMLEGVLLRYLEKAIGRDEAELSILACVQGG